MNTIRKAIGLGLFAWTLAACGGAAAPEADSDFDSSEDEIAKAKAPIAQVVQYEGTFDDRPGSGSFGSIELLRDGTYRHIDPKVGVTSGKFTGPSKPGAAGRPRRIKLDAMNATITETSSVPGPSRALLTITLGARTITMLSRYILIGQSECNDTGGHWTDDDQDRKTGLFCLCKAPQIFTNAAGGCSAAPVKCLGFPMRGSTQHVDPKTCSCIAD